MYWRERGIFRVAGIGILGLLLLAGCSSGTNAPLESSKHWRRESPAKEESPLFDLTQHKRPNISAGGLEAPKPARP